MSSDSGMTPEGARYVLKNCDPLTQGWEIADARAFLEGVAYQEEKAKVLLQALLNSRPDSTWASPDYAAFYKRFTIWEKEREEALAHYRQGQEKNDGR